MNAHSVSCRQFISKLHEENFLPMLRIGKAAVLGAGTMGAGIAAHLANAGIPTLLLDIAPRELTPDEEAKGATLESKPVRNRIVSSMFEAAKKLKPAPFMLADNTS